jgi:hypothetical protein
VKVVDWAQEAWLFISRMLTRGRYCFDNVTAFDECQSFWIIVIAGFIVLGILGFVLVGRQVLRDYLKYRRVLKRREVELEVAAPEVMDQARWTGDKTLDPGLTQSEMIRRIKAEKDRLKATSPGSKDQPKGDPNLGIDVLHR